MSAYRDQGAKPPLEFLPAKNVNWAIFADHPPEFILRGVSRVKGRRGAGIRYEQEAHDYLCAISQYYLPGPWLCFTEAGSPRKRWCQPDGLVLDFVRGKCTI